MKHNEQRERTPGFLTAFTTTTRVATAMRSVVMMPTPDPDGPDLICPDALWFRSEYLHVRADNKNQTQTRHDGSWARGRGKGSSAHR